MPARKRRRKQLADGTIQLPARQATIHGRTAYLRSRPFLGSSDICTWTDPDDWVSWQFSLNTPGEYVVDMRYSCADGSEGSTFEVAVGGVKRPAKSPSPRALGNVSARSRSGGQAGEAGDLTLSIRPLSKPGQAVMNLCRVRLVPAEKYDALRKAESQNPLLGLDRPVVVIPNFHPASCGWLDRFFHGAKLLRLYLSPAPRSRPRRPDLRLRDFRGQQHDGDPGLRAGAVRGTEAADA